MPPTPYPDLNAVLADLVSSVREILGENFVGAYLQGSFAAGDADEHSDVDFLVVMRDEVGDAEAKLQALHQRLFELPTHWAQHLEGSHVPKEQLRRLGPDRPPWFYFDNGATEPAWDNHCNTAVVRWSLREHGVVLEGPDPKTLIERVSADQLRREARDAMQEYADWAPGPTKAGGMSRWKQQHLVLAYCRMLHTLESGRVTSKREAGEWALIALDGEWGDLIKLALDERPDPWTRVYQPTDADLAVRTLAFVDYAMAVLATKYGGTRSAAR